MDDRDLLLIKSNSEISLPNFAPAHAKDLLRIDLQYIAAMQNSLKDPQFAIYMEHEFDAVQQLHEDLEKEGRQMRYWTSMLKGSTENQSMTPETQTAMILNLTRVARTFGESDQKSCGEALHDAQQSHACPSFIVRNDGMLTTTPIL